MDTNDIYNDSLLSDTFLGMIEDIDDSEFSGRCKIRVYSKFDTLPLEDIPWAYPANGTKFGGKNGFGDFSAPRKGTEVRVKFIDGNIYQPEYYHIQNIHEDLINEISNSYENSTSLLWDSDENVKVFYTKEKGLTITCKDSKIQIMKNSTILIQHKDSQSIIELAGPNCTITTDSTVSITAGSRVDVEAPEVNITGQKTTLGPNPIFSALNGEPMWAFINALAAGVDQKYPASPGVFTAAAKAAQTASISKTVKTSP